MSDISAYYMAAPPVARTVATAVFVASVCVYTGMISYQPFIFHYSFLMKFPPALYRFVTSFLLTSPNLGVLFDTYFIFTYLSQLERTNPRFTKKEDLIWYLMFVGTVIVGINQVFTGQVMYLSALLLAIVYTATQDQRGMQAHFYIVNVPAQLLPWCFLLASLLLSGWTSFQLGLTGIVAAHLHDFLTRIYPEFGHGPNLIPTPGFISYILRTPRTRQTSYGTSYAPPSDNSGRGGPLPDSWRSKGPGRRLG
ncbi:Der1-like family protein [Xylariomycetidae sp. FL0641]|nr:Der1-like family protein [Xylariomycetidae sp. FL0641]